VHIIARFKNDAAWPNPVWGKAPPRAYQTAALTALCHTLRGSLDIAAMPTGL
jgi:diadenosine tetraphosphate (Ap4A) HIT family hydrolase